ncbi:hypothetical protein LOK74_12745 [Brevibacillus humidisoli]|uniref:hypothetical protein n=1 Tax=Brevibacillus humidisoli TaxID=2895522 RepID=UPI001E4CEDA3|nr:hypothetical protein [Brevibacillus humidisoli]UFJ38953.1 hypothetical protein LOK74_12745 [Brevibacillus humidisoli]
MIGSSRVKPGQHRGSGLADSFSKRIFAKYRFGRSSKWGRVALVLRDPISEQTPEMILFHRIMLNMGIHHPYYANPTQSVLRSHSGVERLQVLLRNHSGVERIQSLLRSHNGVERIQSLLRSHSSVERLQSQLQSDSGNERRQVLFRNHSSVEWLQSVSLSDSRAGRFQSATPFNNGNTPAVAAHYQGQPSLPLSPAQPKSGQAKLVKIQITPQQQSFWSVNLNVAETKRQTIAQQGGSLKANSGTALHPWGSQAGIKDGDTRRERKSHNASATSKEMLLRTTARPYSSLMTGNVGPEGRVASATRSLLSGLVLLAYPQWQWLNATGRASFSSPVFARDRMQLSPLLEWRKGFLDGRASPPHAGPAEEAIFRLSPAIIQWKKQQGERLRVESPIVLRQEKGISYRTEPTVPIPSRSVLPQLTRDNTEQRVLNGVFSTVLRKQGERPNGMQSSADMLRIVHPHVRWPLVSGKPRTDHAEHAISLVSRLVMMRQVLSPNWGSYRPPLSLRMSGNDNVSPWQARSVRTLPITEALYAVSPSSSPHRTREEIWQRSVRVTVLSSPTGKQKLAGKSDDSRRNVSSSLRLRPRGVQEREGALRPEVSLLWTQHGVKHDRLSMPASVSGLISQHTPVYGAERVHLGLPDFRPILSKGALLALRVGRQPLFSVHDRRAITKVFHYGNQPLYGVDREMEPTLSLPPRVKTKWVRKEWLMPSKLSASHTLNARAGGSGGTGIGSTDPVINLMSSGRRAEPTRFLRGQGELQAALQAPMQASWTRMVSTLLVHHVGSWPGSWAHMAQWVSLLQLAPQQAGHSLNSIGDRFFVPQPREAATAGSTQKNVVKRLHRIREMIRWGQDSLSVSVYDANGRFSRVPSAEGLAATIGLSTIIGRPAYLLPLSIGSARPVTMLSDRSEGKPASVSGKAGRLHILQPAAGSPINRMMTSGSAHPLAGITLWHMSQRGRTTGQAEPVIAAGGVRQLVPDVQTTPLPRSLYRFQLYRSRTASARGMTEPFLGRRPQRTATAGRAASLSPPALWRRTISTRMPTDLKQTMQWRSSIWSQVAAWNGELSYLQSIHRTTWSQERPDDSLSFVTDAGRRMMSATGIPTQQPQWQQTSDSSPQLSLARAGGWSKPLGGIDVISALPASTRSIASGSRGEEGSPRLFGQEQRSAGQRWLHRSTASERDRFSRFYRPVGDLLWAGRRPSFPSPEQPAIHLPRSRGMTSEQLERRRENSLQQRHSVPLAVMEYLQPKKTAAADQRERQAQQVQQAAIQLTDRPGSTANKAAAASLDVNRIVEKVYKEIERRLSWERQRSGV